MDITHGADMANAFMQERLASAKVYCVMILNAEPNLDRPGAGKNTAEQGRRNIRLQARDLLLAACRAVGGSDVMDLPILAGGAEEAEGLAADDAGGRAGIVVYEVHPFREFTTDGFF